MITLGLLGFDAALHKSLSIAIRSRAAGVCQYVEPEQASVLLVDVDNIQDQQTWKQLKDANSLKLIAASQNRELPAEYAQDFIKVLPKPLRFTAMLEAVSLAVAKGQEKTQRIKKSLMTRESIDVEATRRSPAVLRSKTEIDPDDHLLGFAQYSLQLDSVDQYRYIRLDEGFGLTDGKWLVIDKRLGRVYLSINEKVISHTAIMAFSRGGIAEQWIDASQLARIKSAAVWDISVEAFIWILTRDTVRNGRMKGFDPQQPYRLKHWPDLVRYSTGSRDIAMASFWIDNATNTVELASKLGLSFDEVLPFATCCFTCGLLEEVDQPVVLATQKPRKGIKKVLSMILKKLDR